MEGGSHENFNSNSLSLSLCISFLFFNSCNKQESTINTTSPPGRLAKDSSGIITDGPCGPPWQQNNMKKQLYDTLFKSGTKIDSECYEIDGPDCLYRKYYWITNHYESKPGKLVGVWPYDRSKQALINLRTHYGYSGIYLDHSQSNYDTAVVIGYTNSNMMMNIQFNPNWGDFEGVVNSYNVKYYYTDESVEHGCMGNGGLNHRIYHPDELFTILNYIHTVRPNSEYVSSGYKRCFHFDVLASIVDQIMYSSYSDWYLPFINLPCNPNMNWGPQSEAAWLNGDDDQRPDWSDMKVRYGNKFSMTWINTNELYEFDDLFGHAQNLGLNAVWIYCLDGHHTDRFEDISYEAWKHGFLRRWIEEVEYVWRCSLPDPCSCDPACWPENYYLLQVIHFGNVQEVFP